MDVESSPQDPRLAADHMSTLEAARLLGLAVRSVQLMVDRGDLDAWKTPGGHRRISRASVELWRNSPRKGTASQAAADSAKAERNSRRDESLDTRTKVLLIEDSVHFQNLVTMLLRQQFPDLNLQVASDGISGLVMAGKLQPEILMVDILLPGIDGAALIASLRSHPQFRHSQLLVITSLDAAQLKPYAFALQGVPVIHKPRLVADLPPLLTQALTQLHRLNSEPA